MVNFYAKLDYSVNSIHDVFLNFISNIRQTLNIKFIFNNLLPIAFDYFYLLEMSFPGRYFSRASRMVCNSIFSAARFVRLYHQSFFYRRPQLDSNTFCRSQAKLPPNDLYSIGNRPGLWGTKINLQFKI